MDGMAFEETWFFISVCKLVGQTKRSYFSSEVSFQRWISRQLEGKTPINPPKRNPMRMRAKTKNWYVLWLQNSVCCCYFLVLSHKVYEILSLERSFHNMDATIRFPPPSFFIRFSVLKGQEGTGFCWCYLRIAYNNTIEVGVSLLLLKLLFTHVHDGHKMYPVCAMTQCSWPSFFSTSSIHPDSCSSEGFDHFCYICQQSFSQTCSMFFTAKILLAQSALSGLSQPLNLSV